MPYAFTVIALQIGYNMPLLATIFTDWNPDFTHGEVKARLMSPEYLAYMSKTELP